MQAVTTLNPQDKGWSSSGEITGVSLIIESIVLLIEAEREGCSKLHLRFGLWLEYICREFWFLFSVVVSYFHTPHSALELVLERVHIEPFDSMVWFIFCICVTSFKMCISLGLSKKWALQKFQLYFRKRKRFRKLVMGPAPEYCAPEVAIHTKWRWWKHKQSTYLITKSPGKRQAKKLPQDHAS